MKYLPEKVKEVVEEHITEIESRLPKFLEAYYIYGFVSFEAFNYYGNSDIGFIAVVKRKATEKDIDINFDQCFNKVKWLTYILWQYGCWKMYFVIVTANRDCSNQADSTLFTV